MAITIAYDSESPGKGGARELRSQSSRAMKIVTGTLALQSGWLAAGISISDIFDQFTTDEMCLGVMVNSRAGYVFDVDYTNQKLLAYWVDTSTDGAPMAAVVDTTDLSLVTGIRFIAFGFA